MGALDLYLDEQLSRGRAYFSPEEGLRALGLSPEAFAAAATDLIIRPGLMRPVQCTGPEKVLRSAAARPSTSWCSGSLCAIQKTSTWCKSRRNPSEQRLMQFARLCHGWASANTNSRSIRCTWSTVSLRKLMLSQRSRSKLRSTRANTTTYLGSCHTHGVRVKYNPITKSKQKTLLNCPVPVPC
jgi:hypothetical protein